MRNGFMVVCIAALTLMVASCAAPYVPAHPQYTEIPDGGALPIDGDWHNGKGLSLKIEKGKMYTINDTVAGIPAGSVLVKDIRLLSPGKYSCKSETYNAATRCLDYGDGEIRVLSHDTLEVVTFPNINTKSGLLSYQLHNIRLVDDRRFAEDLLARQQSAAAQTPVASTPSPAASGTVSGFQITDSGDGATTIVAVGGDLAAGEDATFVDGELVYWLRFSGDHGIRGKSGAIGVLRSGMSRSEVEAVCQRIDAPITKLQEDRWRIDATFPVSIGFTGDRLTHMGNR